MSVRNDHELPRSQADASDDAHTWTDQGPLEVQEAMESIVASLPAIAQHVSSIPDGQKATALDALERHYLQTALGLGYSEEPARSWVAALMAHLQEQLELISMMQIQLDIQNERIASHEKLINDLSEEVCHKNNA